eukprot:CAMPEP_0170058440 /NCGR_PEP_ID=MMETSP0019_2-20121128/1065_1 /TAXON_ID=98059 /ORGANISM="Dinobryon sp., Strain UTEXLB2267" /LENGTH=426 /DNA_ID=CAMNT_0010263387 /DNA_START=155 /DNA_END=1432 /DNA_ORIENTATION=-
MNSLVNIIRKGGNKKLGSIYKGDYQGTFIPTWMTCVEQNQLERVEISNCLGLFFAVKDAGELDSVKRAAILSNKVMKHGFVQEMENIIDNDLKITHDALSTKVDGIISDTSLIGLKIAGDFTDSCYQPIIQSGGKYDIKVSASSNQDNLSPDVIICSLGARYKGYCANISRTFMVDAPTKVEKTYGTLLACLECMIPGNELKDVVEGAKTFLKKKDPTLLTFLPKNLGFAIGLEFRDGSLVLNNVNTTKFAVGMVFNLAVGFHNVPLTTEDKEKSPEVIQRLEVFSMLIADVVAVQKEGLPEVLTKLSKEFGDVSYSISNENEGAEDADDDDVEVVGETDADGNEVRRSSRAKDEKLASESAAQKRQLRQKELMEKKLAEARRRMGLNGGLAVGVDDLDNAMEAKDLVTYRSAAEFPKDLNTNKLK